MEKKKDKKYLKKLHERLKKPLLKPVKKGGARVNVQKGIKGLLDLT